ncbi:MAG: hypothetical protein UT66_C0027G0015 [candidate division CPR2 bacterium GW2011_GWC1_39_9]|uniref:Uncharacterized protein n=1 Tax=candidate division CPR2 bacterium GW2011_GWC2_39_10 TaxID=1618345 RepID=A0A0G0P6C6_UNCC2|nr:MAG: hypothetical protein UT18_C0017G0024 [candidate division CPR2 bacterium GW2011_GWC2_39_10]KKR34184.1 MAG: hypothetical protein UT66_C0027G0015 [candidate division CPR2 bacterium GW2011_GWC1_39_9]
MANEETMQGQGDKEFVAKTPEEMAAILEESYLQSFYFFPKLSSLH